MSNQPLTSTPIFENKSFDFWSIENDEIQKSIDSICSVESFQEHEKLISKEEVETFMEELPIEHHAPFIFLLQKMNDKHIATVYRLRSKLKVEKKHLDDLMEDQLEEDSFIKQLTNQIKQIKDRNFAMKEKLNNIDAEREKLENDNTELESKVESLTIDLDSATNKMQKLQTDQKVLMDEQAEIRIKESANLQLSSYIRRVLLSLKDVLGICIELSEDTEKDHQYVLLTNIAELVEEIYLSVEKLMRQ